MATYVTFGQVPADSLTRLSDELELGDFSGWFENRDFLSITATATRQPESITPPWQSSDRLDWPAIHCTQPEFDSNPNQRRD